VGSKGLEIRGAKKMGAAYAARFIDFVWQIVVMFSPLSCIYLVYRFTFCTIPEAAGDNTVMSGSLQNNGLAGRYDYNVMIFLIQVVHNF
jgi:hypothetical protein